MFAYFWKDSPRKPAKNAKNAKDAKNATKSAKKANRFRNSNPWIQPRRPILSQWPRQKKVGGGGPPQGVTINYRTDRTEMLNSFLSILTAVPRENYSIVS